MVACITGSVFSSGHETGLAVRGYIGVGFVWSDGGLAFRLIFTLSRHILRASITVSMILRSSDLPEPRNGRSFNAGEGHAR